MTLALLEFESTSVDLSDATARRLAELAKGALEVTPERVPGKWRLTASSKVGSITVDGVRILIRPKIRAENLFLFLEAGLPPDAWRAEAFDYGTNHDLLPAVLSFFARTVETTLATGLLRSYQQRHERLVALRGRIDFPAQLARGALPSPIACRFDDYTTDIEENRYLRAALRYALRAPRVPMADRRRLLRSLAALEDVADVGVRPDALDRMVSTRLNGHYWPALRLARLVMENLTLVDVRGAHSASAFLIDMNSLFERFLTQRLADALRGRLQLHAQAPAHLDVRSRIPLRPDLVFRRGGEPVFVADIKYKLTDEARGRREDYYQLLAYTTALNLPEGLLIYCRAPDGEPASTATVVHAGTLLHARAIDASGPPETVAAEVAGLAEWLVSRCPRPGSLAIRNLSVPRLSVSLTVRGSRDG